METNNMSMRALYIWVPVLALFLATQPVMTETIAGTVTYRTSRSVYVLLDGDNPTAEGDSVLVGLSEVSLEPARIKAIAGRKIVLDNAATLNDAAQGTQVVVNMPGRLRGDRKENPVENASSTSLSTSSTVSNSLPTLDGRVALQYYYYRGPNGKTAYDQPSLFFDIESEDGNEPLSFHMRLRTRMQRELATPDGGELTTDRRDRFYDMALEYNRGSFTVIAGRTRRIRSGGMGGIDGIVVEAPLTAGIVAGLFGGVSPELDNFIGDSGDLKRGGYLAWETVPNSATLRGELTVSYFALTPNEAATAHLLYFDGALKRGTSLFLNGEAAVNLHTADVGRYSRSLQNARAYMSYTFSDNYRASLSYFGYLVAEYRDLDRVTDPLSELRYEHAHTLRPSIDLFLPYRVTLTGELLLGDDPIAGFGVLSGAIRTRKTNLLQSGMTGALGVIATQSRGTKGTHLNLSLSPILPIDPLITLSGSVSNYQRTHTEAYYNESLRLGIHHPIGRTFHWSAYITRNWGQYTRSSNFFIQAGYRI